MDFRKLFPIVALAVGLTPIHTAWADGHGRGHSSASASAAAPSAAASAPASGAGTTAGTGAPATTGTGPHRRRELTEEQKAKRKERMAELRAKWGAMLKQPGVKEEMHKHLTRLAKLRRIAHLAKEAKKEGVQKRAQTAIEKEKKRHQGVMDELKGKGGAAPSGTGTAVPAAPSMSAKGGK